MVPDNDDVADRILEGDAYDRAEVTVSRTFPLRLVGKIRVAVGVLALSGLLAPTLYLSRNRIQSFESAEALSGSLGLTIATLALIGIATAFTAGLLLVAQRYYVRRRSLTEREARRLVRTEDVLMWFVLQGGAFVLIPVALAVAGLLSADTLETLYRYDVPVYAPDETVGIDARLTSAIGGTAAAGLYALCRRIRL